MQTRISREQMMMEWAYTASKRGTCGRLAVGAIIARNSHPISVGYVGPPAGCEHCNPTICPDLTKPCTRTVHAEANALLWAEDNKINVVDADMFVTNSPCLDCAVMINENKIARVYYDQEYRVKDGIHYLLARRVQVFRILMNGMIRPILHF